MIVLGGRPVEAPEREPPAFDRPARRLAYPTLPQKRVYGVVRAVTTSRRVPDGSLEAAGGEVRLEALDAARADDRVVDRACRQIQAIARDELDGLLAVGQSESDRTALDGDDLVVGVLVGRIPNVRSVRLGTRFEPLVAQPLGDVDGWHVRHPR